MPSIIFLNCRLHDSAGKFIAQYEVTSILYFTKGAIGTPEEACFAFTCPLGHAESQESTIFQCHVFRCDILEAVCIDFYFCL